MADTLVRLSGPTALTTSAVTQYTVPALVTAVIRNMHVCNESSNPESITVSIGADAAGLRVLKDFMVPGNGLYDWSGSLVLDAGEIIQAFASAGSALTLICSGVESA